MCSATSLYLAASKLSGYRALNVSRPALQIPITPFLVFTFPRLPLTLRFRLIPLSRRRRGIWPGCHSLSLLACGHSDSQHAVFTLCSQRDLSAIDLFKSIFSFGKKSQSTKSIFRDFLRFIAIFFLEIKLDTGKRLKRTVKIYSLHGLPVRYSRKFKIDRVESYRMTRH